MKNNYKLIFIVSIITCFCIVFSLFWISFKSVAFDKNFYKNEYHNLNIYNKSKIIEKDYINNLDVLLEYIQKKRSNLEIKNNNVEVFSIKEIDHMKDVQALYILGEKVFYILFFISITGIILLFILNKDIIKALTPSFTYLSGITLLFLIIIIIKVNYDFSLFWHNFHKIIFINNLWLLSSTDTLIKMFPIELFKNLVQSILIRFVISVILIEIIILFCYMCYNRNKIILKNK